MSLLPQINNEINSSVKTEVTLPSKTYRLKTDATALQLKKGNKTTLKGTEINITDAKFTEENMTSIKLKGLTTQATRSGKNKFSGMSSLGNDSTYENGILTIEASTANISNIINVQSSTTYIISNETNTTTRIYVVEYDSNGNIINTLINYKRPYTFTTSATTKSIDIRFYPSTSETFPVIISKIMLKLASISDDAYEEYGVMPPPDYPSDIENVEGKNLFNKNIAEIKVGYISDSNGEFYSGGASSIIYNYIPILPNQDMVLTCNGIEKIIFYDKDKKFINTMSVTSNSTFNVNAQYIKLQITTSKLNLDMIQLEEGTVATPYVPYNSLGIKVEGKNILKLIDGTYTSLGVTAVVENGIITLNGTANGTSIVQIPTNITFKENKNYQLSANNINIISDVNVFVRFGSNASTALTLVKGNASKTINLTTETSFTYFAVRTSSGTAYNDFVIKPQLEEGEIATDYEPYKSQVVYFPLGEGEKLMEGSYLADDGIHHRRKQVVFDGTESWNIWAVSLNNVERFYVNLDVPTKNINTALCSHFKFLNANQDEEHFRWSSSQGEYKQFVIFIDKSKATTVAELKTWLQSNPITVEYELAEPEIVPYIEEQQEAWEQLQNFYLFDGVNNISSDGSKLKPELELSYYDGNNIGLIKTEEDRIVGFVDNLEAIKQSIYHILSIERYAYLIYDDNYGVEFEQYIGKDFDYINATIENTLQEALLYDLRILNVSVDNIKQIDTNIVAIKFTVDTIYGDLIMEVSIDV